VWSSTTFGRPSLDCAVLPPTAARQSFKEHEALVFQQLAQLIRDSVWLKSYIAAVMRVEQEAFFTAFGAMEPSSANAAAVSTAGIPVDAMPIPATPEHPAREVASPPVIPPFA
jgi:hypothetical protein